MQNKEENNKTNSSSFANLTEEHSTKSNAINIPSIALPKGGGAIKGIDEKFSVNAVNGTAAFSIPLPVSQARALTPALTLSYNSGAGNGIFGLGWNLSLSSIRRKTDKKLPQYRDTVDSDVFLFSEAEDLVPVFEKDEAGDFKKDTKGDFVILEKRSEEGGYKIRYYRPRIEGLFVRIERWTKMDGGEIKWKITTKDNTTTLFGWTTNARIAAPGDASQIFEWLPEFVFDDKGNCSRYLYRPEDDVNFKETHLHHRNRRKNGRLCYTNTYLEKLLYGNKTPYKNFGDPLPAESDFLFSTVFDYGETNDDANFDNDKWFFRPDAFSDYKAGFEIRSTRLCKRVLLFHHFNEYNGLVKSVDFQYDINTEQDFTFLKSATAWGYIKKSDGSYSKKSLPPMEFTYQKHDWNKEVKTLAPDALIHAPIGIDEAPYQFVDLFNEGLSGILSEQGNGWYYKHNLGDGQFEQAKLVSPKPSFSGLGAVLLLADLDADGGKQLVSYAEPKGYFELGDDNDWQPFQNFRDLPNVNFNDPYTRHIDLNGDGKPELLITEDQVFTWYESSGRAGFSTVQKTPKPFDEEAGPHLVFADPKLSIFLADMSGSGLTDIVRIRNGEVCYWPNLGYGRFGAKVAMDNAPFFDSLDAFNPAYIKLADIDGSGTADIVYLGKNKFTCWKNLSGNRFSSAPFEIEIFPAIHNVANITVTDLLGNGVACIVWSSPLPADAPAPLRYIDLMNSKKPHIMVAYKNNMGKEVSMEYTASTKFYIEDKLAGHPWVTKLHFPVHCVSKTTTEDKISGHKYTAQYKYHHGYYDHPEREFRGFGMVEQIDAETFEHWTKSGATNVTDAELHQEPIVSKQWIHTGAFLQKDKILTQFEHEYWYNDPLLSGVVHHELPLPDAVLVDTEGKAPLNVSAEEWQQALRACKGMALRSEVFAYDAEKFGNTTEALRKERIPYTVATHSCKIELLQPKGQNRHAVFVVKENEAITYNYERSPEDPRVAHTLNIQLDEYGNVLESASVVYPRKVADVALPPSIQAEQAKTQIIYTENRFTNDVILDNVYRLRLPSEVKTYELRGVAKASLYYQPSDFVDILSNAKSDAVEYHEIEKPLAGKAQRRLIEHIRSTYYRNDLKGALPLHQLESLALPFEAYQLAYTPLLVQKIFGTKVNDDTLKEGRFFHSEGDQNWWIRSGTAQFLQAEEAITAAQNRFYLPISYTEPFGAVTKVKYYGNYHLFIQETEDALGNTSKVELFDFRTLAPRRLRDINHNLSEAISDELGLVKALAVLGKGTEADELTGLTEITEAAENNLIRDFFNAPLTTNGTTDSVVLTNLGKQLLQRATARFVYDFEVYQTTGKPNVVASIVREEHFAKNANSPVQLSFEYSNGTGEVAMVKAQAEPGKAKKVLQNANGSIQIVEIDTGTALRWIGNGRTIKNNKGNPVKQYEPYFSVNNQYEDYKELVETGVTPVLFYDAIGRMVRTEMPDGTFSKVEFDAWKQLVFDANDTVKDSQWYAERMALANSDPQKQAAQKAEKHHNTPNQLHFDTLGRPVLSIDHNKNTTSNADEFYLTFVSLDIEGNARAVTDARGNVVMHYDYDMLGHRVYQNSMDAGQRWLLTNILGNPLRTWDEREHEIRYAYDILHRPTNVFLLKQNGASQLIERVEYGETLANPTPNNLRGKAIKHCDGSGQMLSIAYDFKGNLLEVHKQVPQNAQALVVDWQNTVLEPTVYKQITEYDALNRMARLYNWHHDSQNVAIYLPVYSPRGVLQSEDLVVKAQKTSAGFSGGTRQSVVRDITQDAKGQRIRMRYGNGTTTCYHYDEKTFRLTQLRTTKNSTDPCTPAVKSNLSDPNTLQNLFYTYDPVGNITEIQDDAWKPVFFKGQKVLPQNTYTYDALYRLVAATGREHHQLPAPEQQDFAWQPGNFPLADTNLRGYTEQYQYDSVGNILKMQHIADGGSWTRYYQYALNSNRLLATEMGSALNYPIYTNTPTLQDKYSYTDATGNDKHGSIQKIGNTAGNLITWDYREMIQQYDLIGGGNAYYQYSNALERSRKYLVRNGGVVEERLYLGGLERYRRWRNGNLEEEIETLHVFEGEQRILMVEEVKTTNNNQLSPGLLYRYQYSNHLGSAALELTATGEIISYEEYHPYGTAAYQAKNGAVKAVAKRYRYTGMEREEETGLAYHTARYYLPWLGRWGSADPIGIEGGENLYVYCFNNPNNNNDKNGNNPNDKKLKWSPQEINDALIILKKSKTFSDLFTSLNPAPVIESFSIEEDYDRRLKPYKDELMKKGKLSQSDIDKFWDEKLRDEIILANIYKKSSNGSRSVMPKQEWTGWLAYAKAFSASDSISGGKNKIEIYQRHDGENIENLVEDLAHEFSHFADNNNWLTIPFAPFHESRAEVFAEILKTVILSEIYPNKQYSFNFFSYGKSGRQHFKILDTELVGRIKEASKITDFDKKVNEISKIVELLITEPSIDDVINGTYLHSGKIRLYSDDELKSSRMVPIFDVGTPSDPYYSDWCEPLVPSIPCF